MALSESITLETPITRGETQLSELQVRKPGTGELRGVSLLELMQMHTDSLIKVIPRVTVPPLVAHEAAALDPADMVQLGTALIGFLLPSAAKEASQNM